MEKKKNIIIGVLVAIIILLIGFIVAMLVLVKSKDNTDKESISTTPSKVTEKTTNSSSSSISAEEYEKQLNEKLSSTKSPLEKNYNLQRKMVVSLIDDNYYDLEIKYLYNNKEVISSYIDDVEIGDMSVLTEEEYKIKEIYDSKNNDKYYALYNEEYGDIYGILNIYNTNFELLNNGNISFCPSGITYKNGNNIYDTNLHFKIDNNKIINYVNGNSEETKVIYHKLNIENGIIIDVITKEDYASNYSFAGVKCE